MALFRVIPPIPDDAQAKLWALIERRGEGECWPWKGRRNTLGYGMFYLKGGRAPFPAHRLVVELLRGPVCPDLATDHLCRNTACCNPAHLELVTPRVNTLRGVSMQRRREQAAAVTHCHNGHLLSEGYVSTHGRRVCRVCRRAWMKARYVPRGRPVATHCRSGHEYTQENTHIAPGGKRYCRACWRATNLRRKLRALTPEAPADTGGGA